MVDIQKYRDADLYGLIGVDISAVEADIRKAYRKKALECHPDKNPDNPNAAKLFHELSKALEILLDKSARAAYDHILNAKKAAELRNKNLDSKRQKLKSELEAREKSFMQNVASRGPYAMASAKTPEQIFKEEFDRLQKEGSRLLEEEQLLMHQHIQAELSKKVNSYDSSQHRIKIKWTATKTDNTNGGYNQEILEKYLRKYGDIVVVVLSPKKHGSALVEFKTLDAAEMAVAYEKGNMENPLTLEWIGPPPKTAKNPTCSTTISENDYESLVLRQMRQAEERKRLIEQMKQEEENES